MDSILALTEESLFSSLTQQFTLWVILYQKSAKILGNNCTPNAKILRFSNNGSIALLQHNAKVLALLKVKFEIH